MNRLIIIGNGFDLAHQMKTSYNDFIQDYIKKGCSKAETNRLYSNELLQISRNVTVAMPNINDDSELKDMISFKNSRSVVVGSFLSSSLDENRYSEESKPFTLTFKLYCFWGSLPHHPLLPSQIPAP